MASLDDNALAPAVTRNDVPPSVWRAALAYTALLSLAALVVAIVVFLWLERLGGYFELFSSAASRVGVVLAAVPILGVLASGLGAFTCVLLVRRKRVALWLAGVAAPLTLVSLYAGDRALRSVEGGYYGESAYVATYHLGAIPLALASLGFLGFVAVHFGRTRPGCRRVGAADVLPR